MVGFVVGFVGYSRIRGSGYRPRRRLRQPSAPVRRQEVQDGPCVCVCVRARVCMCVCACVFRLARLRARAVAVRDIAAAPSALANVCTFAPGLGRR